jgi:hypothetical protein
MGLMAIKSIKDHAGAFGYFILGEPRGRSSVECLESRARNPVEIRGLLSGARL